VTALVLYNDDEGLAHGEARDAVAAAGAAKAARDVAAALGRSGFLAALAPTGGSLAALVERIERARPRLIFNLCEAFRGEPRLESAIAGVLEILGIPYTGSRPLALALAQDKALAKDVLAARGLPVARSAVLASADDPLPLFLAPPYFVKTRFEDASHGISERSLCRTLEAAREQARYLIETYAQDALVEEFLPGREFNVGVLFEGDVLPIAEIDYSGLPPQGIRAVTYEAKWCEDSDPFRLTPVRCPAEVEPALADRLREIARGAFCALGCRDYARVDIRLDGRGEPRILEVNPNPDISPEAGLARAASRAGISYDDLVARIARAAIERGASDR
jgi:D-alanine-D-alanine ligase